jgi:putative tryptophan/tyrosine transport system substrate-binding protein
MLDLGRRQFIKLLGGAAAGWPIAARAQQGERMRRVGIMSGVSETDPDALARYGAFRQGLQQLGWTEGRNIQFDSRFGLAGKPDLVRKTAPELLALAPDVILAAGALIVSTLQQMTRTPIVFAGIVDPVGAGLVESLARPGGNTTWFTNFEFSMAGKWLELLKEVAPPVHKVTIMFNPDNAAMPGQLRAIAEAASALGLQIVETHVRDSAGIERAIKGLALASNVGLVVLPEFVTTFHRGLIAELAVRHRVPAVYSQRNFIESGGLICYGPDNDDVYRRAASYVDRILRGEKPADLPIQQPTKFELVINLKAAKAIGLEVPPTLLALADEVIE